MTKQKTKSSTAPNQNTPQLRFPEFEGAWEKRKLGEICKMQAGNFINASEISDNSVENMYPCFGGNGLRGYTKEYNQDGIYSLIGRQGAKCGNITLATGKFYATEHAVIVKMLDRFDSKYIFYVLNNLNLNQYSTGLAQPGLSVQNLEKVEAKISESLPEQTKIATFLTAVDEKIQALKKKKTLLESYKKGVMQQLFQSAHKGPNPRLRFKISNDKGELVTGPDWEVRKLGEVAIRKSLKNKEDNKNVLTISAQFGLISQTDFFNKSVSAKDLTGYYLLERGDFAYNKSYSNGYPMGAIKCLNRYYKGVVSTLYICFRFNETINNSFMEQYFETGIQNIEIEKVAQEGARNHGLLNVGVDDFFSIDIYLPTLPEQTRIAQFLSALDEKINQVQCQIEKTEAWKKGVVQRMFM